MAQNQNQSDPLYLEFLAHGAEPWQARYLTARLKTAFGDSLRRVLDMFWVRQWLSNQVWDLERYNRFWRRQPEALFAVYDALKELGCPENMALLAVYSPSIFKPEEPIHNMTAPQKVWDAIRALRECGYDDSLIRTMMSAHPKAFLKPRDVILEWHGNVTEMGVNPLMHFRRLASGSSKTALKKRPTAKGYTTELADFPRENPHDPLVSQSDLAESIKAADTMPAVAESDVRATPEFTLELPAETAQDVPAQIQQALADLKPCDESAKAESSEPPELILAVPDAKAYDPPPSSPGLMDQPCVAQTQPAVPKPQIGASSRPPSIPKPPRLPSVIPVPIPVTREPPPPPYVPEERVRNWEKLAQAVLAAVAPKWNDAKWTKWRKENEWIASTVGTEVKNLEQLFAWVAFSDTQPPNDGRTRLIASILLGRDLTVKRKSNGRSRTVPNLVDILRLPEEAVYFRCYVLRSIMRREFTCHPDALAYAWENVVAFENPTPRNFSIPPPPMTDEAMWKAKAAELRFRANEIESHGYMPGRKPFVLMALEPTRAAFLKRLEKYVRTHGPGVQTKRRIRNSRKVANPYLSLS